MDYTVYYIIEENNHGFLNQHTTEAENESDAIEKTKEYLNKYCSKSAFCFTCEKPKFRPGRSVVKFNGAIYMRYDDTFHMLW